MNLKPGKGWLKHADFIIIDMLCLQLSFVFAYWIISGYGNPYINYSYRLLAMTLLFAQVLTILFGFNYKGILRRGYYRELISVLKFTFALTLITIVLLFVVHMSTVVSRLQLGTTIGLYVVIDYAARVGRKRMLLLRSTGGVTRKGRSMVLITAGFLVDEAMKKLTGDILYVDYFISGVIVMDHDFDSIKGDYEIPVVDLNEAAIERLRVKWVDEVFMLHPSRMRIDTELMNAIVDMGITVNFTLALFSDDDWPALDLRRLGSYKVLTSSMNFMNPVNAFIKRAADILGGIVGCIFTAILVVFIGPAIYMKSPGPIFFTQDRVGKNGKIFRLYKFRSMYLDAEDRKAELMDQNKMQGLMFKMDDDPRIIGSEKKGRDGKPRGIGNFIRNTSLDEFPQFWNVLKGDMSLVGTRPPTLQEFEQYSLHHRARMTIRPGITGMWQVSGRSEITDFEEVVRLDKEYIENWSMSLDVKIILKTIIIVVKGRGAE